jgi:hypothetical protein
MSKATRFVQPLIEPGRNPWIFLVGVVLLGGVAASSFANWLNPIITPGITLLFTLVILFLLLLAFFRYQQSYTLRPTIVPHSPPIQPHRGLIVFVSPGKGSSSAERAIRYHWRGLKDELSEPVLEQCWLVTGGPASEREAANLKERLSALGISATIFTWPIAPSTAR